MALIMPGFLEVYTSLCFTLIKGEQCLTTSDPFRLAAFGSFINLTPQPGVMLGLCFCSPVEHQVPHSHAAFRGVVDLALPRVTWLVDVRFLAGCCFPGLQCLVCWGVQQSLSEGVALQG